MKAEAHPQAAGAPAAETGPTGYQDPLPCRGCTRNCSDYQRCQGTPWRLKDKD